MGPTDEDEEYARECFDLVELMELPDVVFTGRVNVTEYLGGLDFTILTSISEGQPLTILEGYAAKLPAIATDVGNCRGLLYGEDDDFGENSDAHHECEGNCGCHGESCQTSGLQKTDGRKRLPPCDGKVQDFGYAADVPEDL